MKNISVIKWIGLGLSVIGTVCSAIFFVGFLKDAQSANVMLMFPAFFCSVLSYLFCGGLGYTIKAAFGIARFMWRIIPHFPADILLGFAGLVFALFALFFLPLFFTVKSVKTKQVNAALS